MKTDFYISKAKQYLKSWQRLDGYGFCGRFLSPEAKQFKKEQKENPEFEYDNIFTWLIKKVLSHLQEEKTCGSCLLRRIGDSWCTKYGKKTTIDREACKEWIEDIK